MLKVGLTGGIGIGKSYVANQLRELGCHVFDADQIARDVVAPGTLGHQRVVAEFGNEIVAPDGHIDRARLGQIVFSDEAKRIRLNEILHPIIIAEQDRLLGEVELADPHGIAIIDAALMIETGSYKRFEKIIVVYCDREVQIERVMRRNHLSREAAEARVNSQMPAAEKRRYADFEIDTTGSFDETYQLVVKVYQQLRELAQMKR